MFAAQLALWRWKTYLVANGARTEPRCLMMMRMMMTTMVNRRRAPREDGQEQERASK